jgi:hypothetical protein
MPMLRTAGRLGGWQRRIQNNLLSRRYWGYGEYQRDIGAVSAGGVGDQPGGGAVVVSEGVKYNRS